MKSKKWNPGMYSLYPANPNSRWKITQDLEAQFALYA